MSIPIDLLIQGTPPLVTVASDDIASGLFLGSQGTLCSHGSLFNHEKTNVKKSYLLKMKPKFASLLFFYPLWPEKEKNLAPDMYLHF